MMITTMDYMLCDIRHCLWSFVGFTLLSKVLGLYLVIALVDLRGGDYEWGTCICCNVMNSYWCIVDHNMILDLFWLCTQECYYTWLTFLHFMLLFCVVHGLVLRNMWLFACMSSWLCIRLFKSNLAWFWKNDPLAWF